MANTEETMTKCKSNPELAANSNSSEENIRKDRSQSAPPARRSILPAAPDVGPLQPEEDAIRFDSRDLEKILKTLNVEDEKPRELPTILQDVSLPSKISSDSPKAITIDNPDVGPLPRTPSVFKIMADPAGATASKKRSARRMGTRFIAIED